MWILCEYFVMWIFLIAATLGSKVHSDRKVRVYKYHRQIIHVFTGVAPFQCSLLPWYPSKSLQTPFLLIFTMYGWGLCHVSLVLSHLMSSPRDHAQGHVWWQKSSVIKEKIIFNNFNKLCYQKIHLLLRFRLILLECIASNAWYTEICSNIFAHSLSLFRSR